MTRVARLYLITHAHTRQNPDADARGWTLSPDGQRQAELLARQPFWSSVDRVVLSSEPKTRLTAAPACARYGLSPVMDARFDELRRPGWVDDYGARVQAALAAPERSAGDWEPAGVALARFCRGVDELVDTLPGQTLVLVSHGLVLSLYRAHLLGQTHVVFEDWQRLDFGAVAVVDIRCCILISDFVPVASHTGRG